MAEFLAFLEKEWAVLTGAPFLVTAWTAVTMFAAWRLAWKLKKEIDLGEVRNLQTQIAILKEREEYREEKFEDLERHIEKMRREVLRGASPGDLDLAALGLAVSHENFKDANTAFLEEFIRTTRKIEQIERPELRQRFLHQSR
jgi:hypothetical protein